MSGVEVVTGPGAVIAGVVLWNDGWFHWLLIGTGLLGVSVAWRSGDPPARGARSRDPRQRPRTTPHSRTSRRKVQVPISAGAGFVIGYVVDGLGAAIFTSAVTGVSAALGALVVFMRRFDR